MVWVAMPEHLIREEPARPELLTIHAQSVEGQPSQLYPMRRTDNSIMTVTDALWIVMRDSSEELERDATASK